MNPYPFAPLNHFTVPFSLTKNSFRLCSVNEFFPSSAKHLLPRPPRRAWKAQLAGLRSQQTRQTQRLLSSAPASEKLARSSGAQENCANCCTAMHETSTTTV